MEQEIINGKRYQPIEQPFPDLYKACQKCVLRTNKECGEANCMPSYRKDKLCVYYVDAEGE